MSHNKMSLTVCAHACVGNLGTPIVRAHCGRTTTYALERTCDTPPHGRPEAAWQTNNRTNSHTDRASMQFVVHRDLVGSNDAVGNNR